MARTTLDSVASELYATSRAGLKPYATHFWPNQIVFTEIRETKIIESQLTDINNLHTYEFCSQITFVV